MVGEHEIITITQLPVIVERLAILSADIDKRIAEALALPCDESCVKMVKQERTNLTKDFNELEERRKYVKNAIMEPYNEFESAYKQHIGNKFKDADAQLKSKIDEVENELRERKRSDLKRYFDEYAVSQSLDFVTIDKWNPNITLSATLKSLKAEAKEYIDRICEDLKLIDTQEHKAEILVEYHKTLNVSQAVTNVTERHKAVEEQKRKQLEDEQRRAAEQQATPKAENNALEAPLVVEYPTQMTANERQLLENIEQLPGAQDQVIINGMEQMKLDKEQEVKTLAFKVTAPIYKLRELKKFLVENSYEFE